MNLRRLYMDNSATSFPKPQAVTDAMVKFATELGASASRGAYKEAFATGEMVLRCRKTLAQLFHAETPENFIFTLNCTDALNLAIKGLLGTGKKQHALCTQADHNSVLRPLHALVEYGWVDRTVVPLDPMTGAVNPADIRKAIRPNTRLIVAAHVSNVSGAIQDIRAIGTIAREHGIPFLVDAAQSAGHLPIHIEDDNIDLLAAPGHKGLLGPQGTGFLYIHPRLESRMNSFRQGGTGSLSEGDVQPEFMPDKFESGSLNAIGISGLLEGLQWICETTVERIRDTDEHLCKIFLDRLSGVKGLCVYGPKLPKHRVGVFSVRLDGMTPLQLAQTLEQEYGVLTRSGLHCAPLMHRFLGTLDTGGTTRFSFGPFLTEENVRDATDALLSIAALRQKHPTWTEQRKASFAEVS